MNGNFFRITTLFLALFFCVPVQATDEIEVLVSSNSPIYFKVLSGLQYSLEYPAKILYLNESRNELTSITNLNDTTKPIITIGNSATSYIRKNSNRKIIFSVTNFSKENIEYAKGNSCGSFSEVPVESIFKILKDLFPSIKKITSFYSTNQENYYSKKGTQIDLFYGIEYKAIQLNEEANLKLEIEKLKNSTDAFFIIPDPIYNKDNFEMISNFSKENKVLLFSNLGSLTELGMAFSLDLDYFDVGLKTGYLANRVFKKEIECDKGPYTFPEKEIFKINQEYLQASGFELTEAMTQKTETDRLYNTAVDLFFRGKRETSINILNYINKKYPNNKSSNEFLKFVVNEKYEKQIRLLIQDGNQYLQNKKFVEAKNSFTKVLNINPSYPGIKEKIQESTFLHSEQKRTEANSLENSKNYFQAIKIYAESLRILSSNTQAKQQLDTLRRKLKEKIPSMHTEGLSFYDSRKYNESIQVYEKILLIDADDKKAKEYLRLSMEKKEALEKLKNCKDDKVNPCSI
jgi:ABC-type uncharacterized transport system substrate-binding protein